MKKYRCIEEYIPVDEYGSIIEKEPLNQSTTSRSSSMNHEKAETEPKGGGYFTTTTTTTLAPEPVEASSDAISPNGLNIQRIKHSPTPKYNEKNEKKTIRSNSLPPSPPSPPPRQHAVDGAPDTIEFVDEEPEIRRSSEKRPSQFRRPPQREYDDYQYFESDRDYLGPEYYPRPSRIPYYSSSQSHIPTRSPHQKRIPSYEAHRPIPYNGNEYVNRHFYSPPSQPKPLPIGRDDRWQSPIPVHALPPQRQQFIQSSRPRRPLPSSHSNGAQQRPPPHPVPTLSPNPLPASPPPRQHPLLSQRSQSNPPQLYSPPPPTPPPKKNLQMTPDNCQKVKSFASSFGVKNPQTWVRQNCLFAQTFVPNTSCEDLATFVDSCYRHHFL
uniref:aECM cysteine-cradle domain-containing protein n=1 Tax=Panagrolaimus superbus TaxID=310955 RepID=A0A914YFY7_9BILA